MKVQGKKLSLEIEGDSRECIGKEGSLVEGNDENEKFIAGIAAELENKRAVSEGQETDVPPLKGNCSESENDSSKARKRGWVQPIGR